MVQDTAAEIAFFTEYATQGEYDVFTEKANHDLMVRCVTLGGWVPGMRVLDLGCGSGLFTRLLREQGLHMYGADICLPLLSRGHRQHALTVVGADAQQLPYRSGAFDGVLLSGLIHHFPDPTGVLQETYRILKPGGSFVAFDPNRWNPCMWLYRSHASPWYSSKGVTANEQPICPRTTAQRCRDAGFAVRLAYISLAYRYIHSSLMQRLLPLYNRVESLVFAPRWLQRYRAFVLIHGVKHA